MKMIGKGERSYKQTYKKKTSSADPYLPRGASQKTSACEGCHSVYKNKRWYADPELYDAAIKIPNTAATVCPSCLKIRENFRGCILTFEGGLVLLRKQEPI